MKIFASLICLLLLIGCKNDTSIISLNPFEPNYHLKTNRIIKNGFQMKWACDGGLNTYSIDKFNYELCFFEDCIKPGKIIGENYDFHIDSIEDYNWRLSDSLFIDFKKYRDTVSYIIGQFNGKLIEPTQFSSFRYFKFKVLYKNDSIFDCRIHSDPDGILNLTIENWYDK